MVVCGLERFVASRNAFVRIDMIAAIAEWKRCHPGQKPIILIKLRELLLTIMRNDANTILVGGRHKLAQEAFDNFVRKLEDAGAELVFFNDAVRPDPLAAIVRSFEWGYCHTSDILQGIKEPGKTYELRPLLGVFENIVTASHGRYNIRTSYNAEVRIDEEMAQTALADPNVMAVMGRQNVHILYSSDRVQYWRGDYGHLFVEKHLIGVLDRRTILTDLKLTSHQFSMLMAVSEACAKYRLEQYLMCAPSIPKDELDLVIPCVAIMQKCELVRAHCPTAYEDTDFRTFASLIFKAKADEYAPLIRMEYERLTGLTPGPTESTAIPVEPPADDEDFLELLKKSRHMFNIWNRPDQLLGHYMDFVELPLAANASLSNYKSWADVQASVYRRLAGILLDQRRDEEKGNSQRKMICRRFHDEIMHVETIDPEFPSFYVLHPRELYGEHNADAALVAAKWKLLLWALNMDDSVSLKDQLAEVPEHILPTLLTVLYLLREWQITPMVADILLIVENGVLKGIMGPSHLPKIIDFQCTVYAYAYLRGRLLINMSLDFCGLAHLKQPIMFDGVIFHELMSRYQRMHINRTSIQDFSVDQFSFVR